MHTTTIANIAAKLSSTHWLEALSAFLASFLTVTQPRWALSFAVRQHRRAMYTGCALAPSAQPYTMLVANYMSRRSYGLMP
jgi:AcrR family transcriptional regulator